VRRYVALHDECLAIVFTSNGRIRYLEKGEGFPGTCVWSNDLAPQLPPRPSDGSDLTALDEASPDSWLSRSEGVTLFAQTFYQAAGHAMTLLLAEHEEDADDDVRNRRPWGV
jgi:hypothetical protein